MAQKKIIYTAQSLEDLDRIVDHVASNFSNELAVEVYIEIRAAIKSIINFPRLGKPSRIHLLQRELIVKKNTVYYFQQDYDIVIITIRPGREK